MMVTNFPYAGSTYSYNTIKDRVGSLWLARCLGVLQHHLKDQWKRIAHGCVADKKPPHASTPVRSGYDDARVTAPYKKAYSQSN